MRTPLPDFNNKGCKESFYDIREDWSLIEASMATQYKIRLRAEKSMPWSEFVSLLSGIMSDTPLGQIVAIRAEKDPKAIKNFTPEQKRIHSEWRNRTAKKAEQDPEKLAKQWDDLSRMLETMFGKKDGGGK